MRKKSVGLGIILLVLLFIFSLTACVNQESYTVNFIVDGKVVHSVSTNGNEKISLPKNPTKEGCVFVGWFLDNNVCKQAFTSQSFISTPISSNINVYAKWSLEDEGNAENDTYTITFKNNGGTEFSLVTITSEGSGFVLPEPVKEGYNFNGGT